MRATATRLRLLPMAVLVLAAAILAAGVLLSPVAITTARAADISPQQRMDPGTTGMGGNIPSASQDGRPQQKDSSDSGKDGSKQASVDKPPTEDCGTFDVSCHVNNALITIIWWPIKVVVLFIEKMLGGVDRMGLALPDPSGPLIDKYQAVAEKVRPLVLVGMLLMGVLMMARSADYNAAYLTQNALPKLGVAVLGLAFFPQIATMIADLSNGISESFYKDSDVVNMLVKLIHDSIIANITVFLATLVDPAGWTIAGIIAAIFIVPVLIMVAFLFVVTYLNSLFFSLLVLVGPLALSCYAVPGLSRVTDAWFKGVLATATAPVLLSIEVMLMSWAATHAGDIGAGSFATIVIAVLLLWMMVKTPGKVYHWAFGAFGGGEGGAFLAGMGARGLLRMGMKAVAGGATGGLGAAASLGAGAGLGGAASRGIGGASGVQGAASVAKNLSRQQFPSTAGFGGVGRQASKKDLEKTLKNLQGKPGSLRAIRSSGEEGFAAASRIEELKSQVLGGKMDPQEAARQSDAIKAAREQDRQGLAANLADEYGGESEDYRRLIEAEEGSQLSGAGSQVGAMEGPSSERNYEAPTYDGEELARYTARVANAEGAAPPTTTASGTTADTTSTSQDAQRQTTSGQQTGRESGADPREAAHTGVAPGVAPQAGEATRAHVSAPAASQGHPAPQPGEAGYAPERFTREAMSDETSRKADRMLAFVGEDADANRTYGKALAEDTSLRNQQAALHHDAMRGKKPRAEVRDKINELQSRRRQNLDALARDMRGHYAAAKAAGRVPNIPTGPSGPAMAEGGPAGGVGRPRGGGPLADAPPNTAAQTRNAPTNEEAARGIYGGATSGSGSGRPGVTGPLTESDWKRVMGSDFDLRYDTRSAATARAGGYGRQSDSTPNWVPYVSPHNHRPTTPDAPDGGVPVPDPHGVSPNGPGGDHGRAKNTPFDIQPTQRGNENPGDRARDPGDGRYDSTPNFVHPDEYDDGE